MDGKFFSFQKLFLSYALGSLPFCLIVGLLSLIGKVPIHFNETPYYGVVGLAIPILLIPFIGLILGATNWLFLNLGVAIHKTIVRKKKW